MYENNHDGNPATPNQEHSQAFGTAIDSDYQLQANDHDRGRQRIPSAQRIAVLIDSETVEITVENMFSSHSPEVKYMY